MSKAITKVNQEDKLLTWEEYTQAFQLAVGMEIERVVVHPSVSITFYLRQIGESNSQVKLEVSQDWTFWSKERRKIIMRSEFGDWPIAREAQAVFNTVQATLIKKIEFIDNKIECKHLHIYFSDDRELIVFHIDNDYFASLLMNNGDEYTFYHSKCWFFKNPPEYFQGDK